MELVKYLVAPLILTIWIEIGVLFLFKERRSKVYLLSLGMNFVTNISLNLIGYYLVIDTIWLYYIVVLLLEFLIWFLEGIGYYSIIKDKKKSCFYSLACNLCSFLLGSGLLFLINYSLERIE